MKNATNPLLIKQEFMAQLEKTNRCAADVDALIKYFCKVVWWLDNEQLECFEELKKFMLTLPLNLKQEFIPKLINLSQNYPQLVILAENLFNSLSENVQKHIEVPMIFWAVDDAYTLISENEYRYRQAYGKTAWVISGSYRRPSQALDFICYGKVLEMIVKSQSQTLIVTSGGQD